MLRSFRYLAPAVAGAIPTLAVPAVSPAQTALPEIVVQAPSPIITSTQTVAAETEPEADTASLLNGLIIADDVFSPVTVITGELATPCFQSPGLRLRRLRRAPAGRSSADWTISGCASRKTASACMTCRTSARTMRFRSTH